MLTNAATSQTVTRVKPTRCLCAHYVAITLCILCWSCPRGNNLHLQPYALSVRPLTFATRYPPSSPIRSICNPKCFICSLPHALRLQP